LPQLLILIGDTVGTSNIFSTLIENSKLPYKAWFPNYSNNLQVDQGQINKFCDFKFGLYNI